MDDEQQFENCCLGQEVATFMFRQCGFVWLVSLLTRFVRFSYYELVHMKYVVL